MKIYYIEDENGKYLSEDGTRRFTQIKGKNAYAFLRSPQGEGRRFMKLTKDEFSEHDVYIEIGNAKQRKFRKDERREQYVSDTTNAAGYEVLSLDYEETADGEMLSEVIADENVNVEEEVVRDIELDTLRKALNTLSEDEIALLEALYLNDTPMTLNEYATMLGIHFTTVDYRRKRILKKLKSFF